MLTKLKNRRNQCPGWCRADLSDSVVTGHFPEKIIARQISKGLPLMRKSPEFEGAYVATSRGFRPSPDPAYRSTRPVLINPLIHKPTSGDAESMNTTANCDKGKGRALTFAIFHGALDIGL